MAYCIYTGDEARVPAPEYYESSAMSLLAYAVRRTIGAVIVFLILVLLTMFALASVDTPPLRGGPPAVGDQLAFWTRWSSGWATFPPVALTIVGSMAMLVVVRRRLSR
jgi:hypothetical protein